jgi:predicted CXXCH cytochrome family protein
MYGFCNVSTVVIEKTYIPFHPILVILFFFTGCDSPSSPPVKGSLKDSLVYLNHSDSARYVGMNTCRQCHQAIYNTFIETGMGKSFDIATKTKSSGDFSAAYVYDKLADFHYQAFWEKDSLFIKEFRLSQKDTIHKRVEQVNYIIGSGQHTNSHLQSVNGYVNQMPMTYYTQKKQWDLPPGFENGMNTRFSRKIGLECMSCHNAYPDFVMGSENKFRSLPQGIDCERCHGPGSIHVAQRQTGSKVDTAKFIDYSIVNPSKLSIDAQFDICQRCHLQGNAILKEHKTFYDFKPGQKLSDYISVFLPRYKNADDEFIMASHADRLKQSPCFIKSYEKVQGKNLLRPYKEAMTCVTCHNPHVSVRKTNKNTFNEACMNCHGQGVSHAQLAEGSRKAEALKTAHRQLKASWLNCVSCHMPVSGSTDIPHVSVHDHYIRKPITKKEKDKIKTFVGLYSVNEKQPDALTRAKAYIDQYDKFEQDNKYLDSALKLLDSKKELRKNSYALLQLYFIKADFKKIIELIHESELKNCFDSLFVKPSYDNRDAWAAYRIGEAYMGTGDQTASRKWFKQAIDLAPYNLDFRNKYGSALAGSNDLAGAVLQFEFILKENPRFVPAYSNLGYIKLLQGFPAEAIRLYTIGQKLDPDNEALLLNLAGYYLFMKNKTSAREYLKKILNKHPENQNAAMALRQMDRS